MISTLFSRSCHYFLSEIRVPPCVSVAARRAFRNNARQCIRWTCELSFRLALFYHAAISVKAG